mmetsp:Transcript_16508/g.55078  ORF Transcript_16508/g.55078 Transcript_16508/m.55078 type:complete len:129 (+) Transcript_16508:597-983(+)
MAAWKGMGMACKLPLLYQPRQPPWRSQRILSPWRSLSHVQKRLRSPSRLHKIQKTKQSMTIQKRKGGTARFATRENGRGDREHAESICMKLFLEAPRISSSVFSADDPVLILFCLGYATCINFEWNFG